MTDEEIVQTALAMSKLYYSLVGGTNPFLSDYEFTELIQEDIPNAVIYLRQVRRAIDEIRLGTILA